MVANADGNACEKLATGLSQRHIYIDLIRYIGKESNRLEEVDSGLVPSTESTPNTWIHVAMNGRLRFYQRSKGCLFSDLVEQSGRSKSALFEVLAGRGRPHLRNQERLAEIMSEGGLI
jgi:hypothetical protein